MWRGHRQKWGDSSITVPPQALGLLHQVWSPSLAAGSTFHCSEHLRVPPLVYMEARQTSTPHDLRLMLSSAGFEASVLEKLGVQGEEGSEAVCSTQAKQEPQDPGFSKTGQWTVNASIHLDNVKMFLKALSR